MKIMIWFLEKSTFFSQRNLKILGIFSRLSIRDGKERYLNIFLQLLILLNQI